MTRTGNNGSLTYDTVLYTRRTTAKLDESLICYESFTCYAQTSQTASYSIAQTSPDRTPLRVLTGESPPGPGHHRTISHRSTIAQFANRNKNCTYCLPIYCTALGSSPRALLSLLFLMFATNPYSMAHALITWMLLTLVSTPNALKKSSPVRTTIAPHASAFLTQEHDHRGAVWRLRLQ